MLSFSSQILALLLFFPLQNGSLEITTKSGSPRETETKAQVERLIKQHNLSKWYFTKKIVIEDNVIPHSHPVLTLSTRHLKDDELAVSTFVHEQLHWWVLANEAAADKAIEELKAKYPNVPYERPQGSGSEEGTYSHIIVCFLEGSALRQIYGELKAWQVMKFWEEDHYLWVYRTVNADGSAIAAILRKHKLFPPDKTPGSK